MSTNPHATIFINEPSPNYDNSKSYRKQSCWRQWNRLSSLQRSLVCIFLIFGTLFLVYILPSLTDGANKKNVDKDVLEADNPPIPIRDDDAKLQPVLPQDPDEMPHHIKPDKKDQDKPNDQEGNKAENQVAEPPPGAEVEKEEGENQAQPPVLHAPDDRVLEFRGPTNERQTAIVDAFKHSWAAYKKYAWGHDELKPETKGYSEWFGVGLTLVDALDSMYIMNLKEEFAESRAWVADELRLDINKDVNLFEFTIRVLGGLLSTYHLSKDKMFLEKAIEVGDRLMPAFKSGSAVPYADVNLRDGTAHAPRWGPDSSTSEVTTIQLEFKELSRLTGDYKYAAAVEHVTDHIHSLPKKDGLVPIFINANTGRFRGTGTITLGARGDSYYEYLLKMWLQSGKKNDRVKDDYLEAVQGMVKHLMRKSEPNKLLYFGELLAGKNFSPKMDHLVCFIGGTLALGAHNGLPQQHMQLGKDITDTCYQMYKQMPTGLSPEIVYFNMIPDSKDDLIVKPADAHNLERPETLESLFYLYRITGDKKYQDWGWEIFQAFEKYTKLPEGYTSLNNVKNAANPGRRNKMESFWLGETLKYLYLLFSDDQTILPLDQWVFNTEAHPLPDFST